MTADRQGFLFDRGLCVGCEACVTACVLANGLPPPHRRRRVYTFNGKKLPRLPLFHLSLACNHCENPACLTACPASAYRRDPETGAVMLDPERCSGCRYCTWACPFDAPRYEEAEGIMDKCDLCIERLREGFPPACANGCPLGALSYGPMPEGKAAAARGLPETRLGPRLRVKPETLPAAPEIAGPAAAPPAAPEPRAVRAGGDRKITPEGEWPLLVFTLAIPLLCGLAAWGAEHHGPWELAAFLLLGGAAGTLTLRHLGRPLRAWRTFANVKSSWLSREVLGYALFYPLGALALARPTVPGLVVAALFLGLLTALAADRVYRYAEHRCLFLFHSSSAFLSALLWIFLAQGRLYGVLLVIALKGGLFLARKLVLLPFRRPEPGRAVADGARFLALAAAAAWILAGPPPPAWALFLLLLSGEFLDRWSFYAEQDLPGVEAALDGAESMEGS